MMNQSSVYVAPGSHQKDAPHPPSHKLQQQQQQSPPQLQAPFERGDDSDARVRKERRGDKVECKHERIDRDSSTTMLSEVEQPTLPTPTPTPKTATLNKGSSRRRKKGDGNARVQPPAIVPSSPNSSGEFGLEQLTLDSRKRSPPRKPESRHQDQDSRRNPQKRPKTTQTLDRQTSGRSSPRSKQRKTSPRGKQIPERDKVSKSPPRPPQPLEILPSPSPIAEPPPESRPSASKPDHKGNEATSSRQPRTAEPNGPAVSRVKYPTNPKYPGIYLQPESRPITAEQLAAEVKSIYSGLSMVEAKCIAVDAGQSTAIQNGDHWQALIALHRTLLHEHHDFFLASQHPSASPALRRLASKYSMPARMWKHGIHSFLELLRCRLPHSREYMRTFIYFAYHMMALLFETVPSFEDTWIECLGDLGRYRMAIEDDDPRERDSWAAVSQYWYRMAADRAPGVGRLYHHLAILARTEQFQQVYYYCRSFTCVQLFPSARESVMAVFEPIFNRNNTSTPTPRIDTLYVKIHGVLFLRKQLQDFDKITSSFIEQLDSYISRANIKWREHGAWLAISNIGALFDHGSQTGVLRQLFEYLAAFKSEGAESDSMDSESISSRGPPTPSSSTDMVMTDTDAVSKEVFYHALDLTVSTLKLVLGRSSDRNVLPHVHIILALLVVFSEIKSFGAPVQQEYVRAILDGAPWEELSAFATTLADPEEFGLRYETTSFLLPEHGDIGVLPEDYLLRGQLYTQTLYPDGWWRDGEADAEERSIEHASTVHKRSERVLSYMYRLAQHEKWIKYDDNNKSWATIPRISEQHQSPQPSPVVEIGCDQAAGLSPQPSPVVEMGCDHAAGLSPQPSLVVEMGCDQAPPGLSIQTTEDAEMEIVGDLDERESDDSPMDDASSQISDIDSREMLYCREQERLIRATEEGLQSSQGGNLQIPTTASRMARRAGMDLMHTGYTVMVCESDLLRYHQDVFSMIGKGGFPIVIPSNVIAELFNHSKQEALELGNSDAGSARSAIDAIRTALEKRQDIKILTKEGKDMTQKAFAAEDPEFSEQNDERDSDEIVIGVARTASDLSTSQKAQPNGKARPAILVTEHKRTRLKAVDQNVPSMSTSRLKTILQALLVGRRRSSSAGSSICHSGVVTPTEVAG